MYILKFNNVTNLLIGLLQCFDIDYVAKQNVNDEYYTVITMFNIHTLSIYSINTDKDNTYNIVLI